MLRFYFFFCWIQPIFYCLGYGISRANEKSQYGCECSLLKESDYDPAIFSYIDLNKQIKNAKINAKEKL